MLFVPPSMPFMVPEAEAHYMTPGSHTGSHTATGQFTIEDLIISEYVQWNTGESKVHYIVAGYYLDYPDSITITKEIIKPDGTMGATDHTSFGVPSGGGWHQSAGYVFDPFNASGWTMKVCTFEDEDANIPLGQCVEQNFTISFAYLDAVSDDTTPPVLTVPADQTFIITNSTGLVYNFQVSATDNVAIDTQVSMQNAGPGIFCVRGGMAIPTSPGWLFPVGGTDGMPYTMIVCSVKDTAGNSVSERFDVTVNYVPPLPTVTASAYLNSTSPTGRTLHLDTNGLGFWDSITSTWTSDIHSVRASILMPDGSTFSTTPMYCNDPAIYLTYCVFYIYLSKQQPNWDRAYLPIPVDWVAGTYGITWTYYDDGWQFLPQSTVTIPALSSGDTTPPTIVLGYGNLEGDTITRTALNSTGYNLAWPVSFSEDVSDIVSYGCYVNLEPINPVTEVFMSQYTMYSSYYNHLFPINSNGHTVMCDVTNSAGNTTSKSFVVRIVEPSLGFDTTPPVVTVPADMILTATGTYGIDNFGVNSLAGTFIVTATDNVGVTSGPTCIPPDTSGSWNVAVGNLLPGYGTTEVTCTATDAAGNVGTASFNVTVIQEGVDTTLPTVTATAYLNGTSPTGRTLQLLVDDLAICPPECSSEEYIFSVYAKFKMPDGSFFMEQKSPTLTALFKLQFGSWGGTEYLHSYFPIPEDWAAGIYNVVWTNSNGNFNVITSVTIPALPGTEEEEIVIPSWIKNNAGWWADGQIDDRAFVTGLQWLISNGIMNIPPTEQGAGSDDVIPSWIKNNAGWWADDLIDDRNFVTGLQWLITNGIMVIG